MATNPTLWGNPFGRLSLGWDHPFGRFDRKKCEDERLNERINYAAVVRFYHVDPKTLTMPEYRTLCEGVKWNIRLEKGEEAVSWIERNSVPGSVVMKGDLDSFFRKYGAAK